MLFDDRNADDDADAKFEATLKQLNAKMGRRARGLALPATWSDDGYYIGIQGGQNVLVQDRFTQRGGKLDVARLGTDDIEDLVVHENYSEMRAAVGTWRGSIFHSLNCAQLVGAGNLSVVGTETMGTLESPKGMEPKTRRARKALCDNEAPGLLVIADGHDADAAAGTHSQSSSPASPPQPVAKKQGKHMASSSSGAKPSAPSTIDEMTFEMTFVPPTEGIDMTDL